MDKLKKQKKTSQYKKALIDVIIPVINLLLYASILGFFVGFFFYMYNFTLQEIVYWIGPGEFRLPPKRGLAPDYATIGSSMID